MLDLVVGHTSAKALLRSHLTSPQSSYIFHGPPGVGKKTTAIALFRELSCHGTKDAGCECKSCHQVASNTHSDLRIMAPDGLSYGIGQIQDMAEESRSYPSSAPYKFYILDDANTITMHAANSLLKLLEDGPSRTVFVFVLEDQSDLIQTVQSRSVSVKFSTLGRDVIHAYLTDRDNGNDNQKVQLCTNLSDGSVALALNYLMGGALDVRDRVFMLLHDFHKKPLHQVIDAVDTANAEDNVLALFYLLRHTFTDMLILSEPDLEGRVANFDKLLELKRCSTSLGESTVSFGVEELNGLYQRIPLIKATFPAHLKSSLLKIRRSYRAKNSR